MFENHWVRETCSSVSILRKTCCRDILNMFKIQATRLRASETQARELKTSANILRHSRDSPANAVQLVAAECDVTLRKEIIFAV